MTKLVTTLAHNAQLTGTAEPLESPYLRKEPHYDSESYCFSLRQLRTLGANCMEETVADFLLLLQMQASNELAKSAGQDTIEIRKEVMGDD